MAGRLSEKSVLILSLISAGHSYEQIVGSKAGLSYLDIFAAADEALQLNDSDYEERMRRIKERHPRAYERWTEEEDARLASLNEEKVPIRELARTFQRQPSAIRSRLVKLGFEYRTR